MYLGHDYFYLLIKTTEKRWRLGVCPHIAQLQKGLLNFIFFKKYEGFLETESQNDFCFAMNVPGRQLEGLPLCSTCEPCSCSLEEKGESWVFRDALFMLVPLHFSCSVICRSDSSSKDVFLLTPITSSLWLNHFVAVFPTTLPIWEAACLSVAACSLGRRITRSLYAAFAVAVLLTMLCQTLLKSCGFYLFPFKHTVYTVQWASVHVKDWPNCTTSNKLLFLLYMLSESSGKPWKAHCSHHSAHPQFCLSLGS